MLLHDQWWLMIGVALLYVYDSALLLFHNDIVLEGKRNSYRVSAGSTMEFRGRHLFLPNPFCPHRALVRASWTAGQLADGDGRRLMPLRFRLALAAIAPWTWALFGLFVVALPCTLWLGTDMLLLIWLVLTYLTIVAMLWRVYRYRRLLNLSRRAVAALVFDVLLCAPFAINMIRKICLRQTPPCSLRHAAASLLSPLEMDALTVILRGRIETSLGFLEPGSEPAQALLAYLKHFEDGRP